MDAQLPWPARAAAALATAVLLALGLGYYFSHEPAPEIRIAWRPNIDPDRRAELERRFLLVNPTPYENRLAYDLLDTSRANVEALVNERDVVDTDRVSRSTYTIPFDVPYGASWMWVAHRTPVLRSPGVVIGIVWSCSLVLAVTATLMWERRRAIRALADRRSADI
jgi:hypothetical protein